MIRLLLIGTVMASVVTAQDVCRRGCGKDNADDSAGRIVGGTEVMVNRYPWIALITYRGGYYCGGSIINPVYVLSAAHCAYRNGRKMSTLWFGISLGEHNISSSTETEKRVQKFRVKSIITHNNYNDRTFANDIALFVVDGIINYNYAVGPICFPDMEPDVFYNDLVGQSVKVLGWGDQSFNATEGGSDVLKEVDLEIISLEQCQETYSDITSRQICTYAPGKDSCQGDSGGPVVYYDELREAYIQVGLVSFGEGCAGPTPGVNTFVASYVKWIKRQMLLLNYCIPN